MRHHHLAVALALVGGLATAVRAQEGTPAVTPRSLTLAQALAYALDHYPSIKVALEQVNVSAADVRVAKSAYMPRLDAVWQTNRATANNVFGQLLPQSVLPSLSGPVLSSASGDSVWGSAAGALLSWEPVDLGLRGAEMRAAEAGVARARADERLTRLGVQDAVAAAFLGEVGAEHSLTAAEADLRRREALARVVRTLAENELRPGADASRAEAERAAALTRVIRSRQILVAAHALLERVLGMTDGPIAVDESGLLGDVPVADAPRRPAVDHPLAQSGRAAIDLAAAQEAVLAKTDRPRLFLQSSVFARGSGANADGEFGGGANGLWPERANWAAGFQVLMPNLFDLSAVRARRAGAAAATRAESARYDEAVLAVASQDRSAQALVDAAREIARNTPVQLAAARQGEVQARARYDAGLASLVEVAESQSLLAAAEYEDAAARVDVWRALLAQAVARDELASFTALLRASSGH